MRRAGLSILALAAALTSVVIALVVLSSEARYGWAAEPFVTLYLGVLWMGGARVYFGTFRPIAELGEDELLLRPLHALRRGRIAWSAIEGTEQRVHGDRLIIYFRGPRGPRYVAVNLNLVKGRREFLRALEERLLALGFSEKLAGDSRLLTKDKN